jgi:hypothetical protein
MLEHYGQLFEQFWQPFLNRVPDNIEVNVKIAMSHSVPHIPHAAPRYFVVRFGALFPKSTIKPQLPQPQVTVTLGAF